MTAYESWVVDGIPVPHVRTVNKNPTEGIITLECSALKDNIVYGDDDPRDEIASFEEITSQYINNQLLLNGGSKLQIGNGEFITVTDGFETWSTCALARIEINEDNKSDKRIDYTLTIYYELPSNQGSYIYLADKGYAGDYTNISCYRSSDKSGSECTNCTNFGWLEITETQNVRRVEIYGSAYRSYDASLAWIECNTDRQYWTYNADGDLPVGFEKLVWDLDTPSTTVTFQTSNHVTPYTTTDGLGAWIQWIKVIYE